MDLSWMSYLGIIIPVIVVGITAIIVVPLLYGLMRGSARNRQLMTTGLDAEATIINVWETGTRINEQPQIGILLEVHPVNAPAFQSQATTIISFLQASMFQPGARVQVKYDPNDTSKVAISALLGYAGAPTR